MVNGPGVTATSIAVGVIRIDNSAAAQSALGETLNQGSTYDDSVAVANDINAHGGVNGRKLVVKVFDEDATSTQTESQMDEAACANFTQDNPVFAFLDPADAELRACLAKRHVLMIGTSVDNTGTKEFAASPTYFDVGENTPEDEMTNLVTVLAGNGYFTTKWNSTGGGGPGGVLPVKIGILTPDTDRWQDAVRNVLLPALKARGITVDPADVVTYPFPKSTSDNGTTVANIDSSVLKFNSDKVTNLLAVEVNAIGFFGSAAKSQQYYPRFGLTTSNEVQTLVTSGVLPADELKGAVGFGNLPSVDLSDSSAYNGPGLPKCLAAMTAAQISTAGQSVQAVQALVCDQFYAFARAGAAIPTTQSLTDTAMTSTIEGFGTTFQSASFGQASFGPNKHYAATEGFPMDWDATCNCAKYTGPGFTLQ